LKNVGPFSAIFFYKSDESFAATFSGPSDFSLAPFVFWPLGKTEQYIFKKGTSIEMGLTEYTVSSLYYINKRCYISYY
jgi:hypothetical protein